MLFIKSINVDRIKYILNFNAVKFSNNIITLKIKNKIKELDFNLIIDFIKEHKLENKYSNNYKMSKNKLILFIKNKLDEIQKTKNECQKSIIVIELFRIIFFNKYFLDENDKFKETVIARLEFFISHNETQELAFLNLYFLIFCVNHFNSNTYVKIKQYSNLNDDLDFMLDNM
ncbi:hypothetical protein CPAV1605_435 [seawater metagenome]|uniref:Uncharacterized protein n=1 Tax=seawater metagenome TaxID=1561972 RepID=A0A5E8CM12_9ZZZZ